jgi:hypothetical protein
MNGKILGIIFFCGLALSACTIHKVTDKQQLCDQASREASLNQSTPQINASSMIGLKKTKVDEAIKQNC